MNQDIKAIIGTKIKDGREVPNCVPIKAEKENLNLSKFIKEFGEDIPQDCELIHEEKVGDEHIEFDFEYMLNDLVDEKIQLASTGRALPGRKSEQDGISKKTYDYYRVRYVYAEDEFLTRKSGKQRPFCRQMMGANKLYRKEDIVRLDKIAVNPGWGKGGADTYSIWLADQVKCCDAKKHKFYKGGGNCHHFWLRQIYKTTLGVSKTTKIEDADIIGYTKARSEGFTAKKNNVKVAKPPKRMKNKGFIKKR